MGSIMSGTIPSATYSIAALKRVNSNLLAGTAFGALLAVALAPQEASAACAPHALLSNATTSTFTCTGSDPRLALTGVNTTTNYIFANQAITAGGVSITGG